MAIVGSELLKNLKTQTTFACMIQIGDTIVSSELLKKEFVCDLSACKGACCVEGDMGAPLLDDEVAEIEKAYRHVKKYLPPKGVEAIERQGTSIKDPYDNEWVTPLVDGKECAFTVFEEGKALCGIEMAWRAGEIDWMKPVSCHLYPVRVNQKRTFTAVNYDRWDICAPACECGSKLGVKVYQFAKPALVRRFGQDWFDALEAADKQLNQ